MTTTMTVKGQVTVPKKVREALRLSPGDGVEFDVNREGEVVVRKAGARPTGKRDRSYFPRVTLVVPEGSGAPSR